MTQSAESGGSLQGIAFWEWFEQGQVAAGAEGYGQGLYGITTDDPVWATIASTAKVPCQHSVKLLAATDLSRTKRTAIEALGMKYVILYLGKFRVTIAISASSSAAVKVFAFMTWTAGMHIWQGLPLWSCHG